MAVLDSVFEAAARGDRERARRLRAIATVESSLNPAARGDGGRSYGLLQIFEPTARALGYVGDLLGLLDPRTNLELGVKLLSEIESQVGYGDLAAIFSSWNCGVSGGRQSRCRRSDGSYSNQGYIDRALAAYGAGGGVASGGLAFVAAHPWILLLGLVLVVLVLF